MAGRRTTPHTLAFGGGALISAVALVVIPEGVELIATWEAIVAFAAGELVFWGLQVLLDRSKSSMSQLVAMLSDFIPEVIALGAVIAASQGGATLLASIIALQNLPEGFNSFRELNEGGIKRGKILLLICSRKTVQKSGTHQQVTGAACTERYVRGINTHQRLIEPLTHDRFQITARTMVWIDEVLPAACTNC